MLLSTGFLKTYFSTGETCASSPCPFPCKVTYAPSPVFFLQKIKTCLHHLFLEGHAMFTPFPVLSQKHSISTM